MAKILIDFDGTCVKHRFPKIGEDIGAVEVLKELVNEGHLLILFTMRSDKKEVDTGTNPELLNESSDYLTQAIEWFQRNNIPLYGIQKDPGQDNWTSSPKAYGHFMIDDTAIGVPLIQINEEKPFVDWNKMKILLQKKGLLKNNLEEVFIFQTSNKEIAENWIKSSDMSSLIFELNNNFWRNWKHSDKEPTGQEVLDKLRELLEQHNLDEN